MIKELLNVLIAYVYRNCNSQLKFLKVETGLLFSRPIAAVCDIDEQFAEDLEMFIPNLSYSDLENDKFQTRYGEVCIEKVNDSYVVYFTKEKEYLAEYNAQGEKFH